MQKCHHKNRVKILHAEAIKSAVKNPNIFITIIATPPVKEIEKNTRSTRLKMLRREIPNQFELISIVTIQKHIS